MLFRLYVMVLVAIFATARFFKRWLLIEPIRLVSRSSWLRIGQYRLAPDKGPREWVYRWSEHRWNFGPSRTTRYKKAAAAITRRRDQEPITIATYSNGGGTTKTTNAATIAQQVQEALPGIPVLLADKNPVGTVEDVTGVKRKEIQAVIDGKPDEACFTLLDAARNMHELTSLAEVRWRFATMPNTGLFVLTYPENERLDPRVLKNLMRVLSRIFAVVVYDCDQYLDHADTKLVLETVDVVVVPTTHADEKRIRQAANAIDALEAENYRRGHDRIVFVVSKVWFNLLHRGTDNTVNTLQKFRSKAGAPYKGTVCSLPWNWLIKKGKAFLVRDRSRWFRLHALELTALVYEKARSTKIDSSRSVELSSNGNGAPVHPQQPITRDALRPVA